jgi:hypothetical protein
MALIVSSVTPAPIIAWVPAGVRSKLMLGAVAMRRSNSSPLIPTRTSSMTRWSVRGPGGCCCCEKSGATKRNASRKSFILPADREQSRNRTTLREPSITCRERLESACPLPYTPMEKCSPRGAARRPQAGIARVRKKVTKHGDYTSDARRMTALLRGFGRMARATYSRPNV